MKALGLPLWLAVSLTCLASAAPEVELIPSDRLGVRGYVSSKEIQWDCTLKEWGALVQVCRRIPGKSESDGIIAFAKDLGMIKQETWHETDVGAPGDGTLFYRGKPPRELAIYNPNRDSHFLGLRGQREYKRDADSFPILKGMPKKEAAVAICVEWMKKLKIDETRLARNSKGTGGFEVRFFKEVETGWDKTRRVETTHLISLELIFAQQIGNYPAYQSGEGGSISFLLADGGELATLRYTMHNWEVMGEYEILSRDEITSAIKDGFCWARDPIETKAMRVDSISLMAYHAYPDAPQKHFPLIYCLNVRGAEEPKTADYDTIFLPALKQHRDKYPRASKK